MGNGLVSFSSSFQHQILKSPFQNYLLCFFLPFCYHIFQLKFCHPCATYGQASADFSNCIHIPVQLLQVFFSYVLQEQHHLIALVHMFLQMEKPTDKLYRTFSTLPRITNCSFPKLRNSTKLQTRPMLLLLILNQLLRPN